MSTTIRQYQKALSAGLYVRQWPTAGTNNAITLRIRSGVMAVEKGLDVMSQHHHHKLVSQVLRISNRDLSSVLAFLSRRYGANTSLQEAMTRLVAELLDLCGCDLPDAPEGATEGAVDSDTTIVKPPEEQPESSGEERKKDTDEVDGSTQTGDETHGGDSASGEVPDAQSGGGEPQEGGQGEGDSQGEGEATADEIAEIAEAQQALKKSRRAQKRESGKKGGQGNGVFAEFGNLDRAFVRRARAALAALVSSGASEASPRYDHTELVKRLVSHRPLQPARREEAGRPVILVIADVSGSCASFAEPACDVAQACGALGVAGADIVTVRCINVFHVEEVRVNNRPIAFDVEEFRVNNRPIAFDAAQIATTAEFAAWIARKVGGQIEVVIGLGDSDEYTTYEAFALQPSVERMIWLDNYNCNALNNTPTRRQRIAANWRDEGGGTFAPAAHRKLTYMVGCGDAAAMVKGLEMALRG